MFDLDVSVPRGAGVATYPPGATFGPRPLRDWEFVWIIEGQTIYFRDQKRVEAPPGSIVLCRPNATDGFLWDAHRRTRHAYFHFALNTLPAAWQSPASWPLVRLMEEDDIVRPLFRHVLSWRRDDDALGVRLAIAQMLAAFVSGRAASQPLPQDALPDAIERALNYLHQRLEAEPSSAPTLDELARVACVSPEHLCRVFKLATGRGPIETVRLARLDQAAVLLARSNYSLSEIARLCGFAPTHLSRLFKQEFGRSPMQLRQQLRAGTVPPTPRLLRITRAENR